MIPQRVQVAGFLSYKDEQEVRFDSAPVWMLAGNNGSGKSAVFDAITYALFGHHRGGSQNASELINKESNSMTVEFDFILDGQLYRIKRTLRRSTRGTTSGTQQVFRRTTAEEWEPVPDTGKKIDFDRWLHDRIGLTYETFTSSVLLLQGKAEKLLDSKPSGRAEVLAGIVDLERYQRLHEKANTKKLELKARLDALLHQTAAVPEVADAEYAEAELKIAATEDSRRDAQIRVDALLQAESESRRWADVKNRLDTARARLSQSEQLLRDAVAIEAAFARLQELRSVLPAANTVVTMRGQYLESEKQAERLNKERLAALDRKAQADHAAEQSRQKRDRLRKQLSADEDRFHKVNTRLRELTRTLETVRQIETQEADVARMTTERGSFPADPAAAVRTLEAEVEKLTDLVRVLPILERFSTERHDLTVAHRTHGEAETKLTEVKAAGEKLKAEQLALDAELKQATQARSAADEQAAVAKSLADQAAAAAAEFATLSGDKSCRVCGQALTPAHFADEKRRREEAVRETRERHQAALEARTKAAAAESKLTKSASTLQSKLEKKRDEYKDRSAECKHASAEIKRLTESLALRYAEMPEPYRSRIAKKPPADWAETEYPHRDELVGLRREGERLPAAKTQLAEAQSIRSKCENLTARLDHVRKQLDALQRTLPSADLPALRQEHHQLQAEETTLANAITAGKHTLIAVDTEVDKLGRAVHEAVHVLTDVAGKLHSEEVTRKHCTDAIERTRKVIPPEWQARIDAAKMADYHGWTVERDELESAGIEAKHKTLEIARGGLAGQRQEIEDLTAAEAAFPDSARRPTEEIHAELTAARTAFEDRDRDHQDARRHRDVLDSHREQRTKLSGEFTRVDGLHTKYKLLAELLGRDRLQRHLVRKAERQIVDYANAVLDRLSGGQLFLRIVGSDDGSSADKALDLECANRVTGGTAINVAFLSGSQRFRVAVSLALAIGQYASRQHRPIESVIIDEGFGCLDRAGRQVMIQELQNLRGHLHCILLVSHQEEFADAFPDGYRFALVDGSTKVERFAR